MKTYPLPAAFKDRWLHGPTVDLRPFTPDDVTETYQGWLRNPEVVRFLDVAFADTSLEALKAYVAGVIADPNRLFYMIRLSDSGAEIGTANLQIDPVHRFGNYGYMIGEKEYWGTQVSMETQVALFDLAFDELGNRRFYGGARRDNVMSQFNLKRLGFVKEGVFRGHVRAAPGKDEFMDAVYYGLMRDEWVAIRDKFDAYRQQGRKGTEKGGKDE
jgi:ribosomal-protein-alanine N-acetyltransferase